MKPGNRTVLRHRADKVLLPPVPKQVVGGHQNLRPVSVSEGRRSANRPHLCRVSIPRVLIWMRYEVGHDELWRIVQVADQRRTGPVGSPAVSLHPGRQDQLGPGTTRGRVPVRSGLVFSVSGRFFAGRPVRDLLPWRNRSRRNTTRPRLALWHCFNLARRWSFTSRGPDPALQIIALDLVADLDVCQGCERALQPR